MFKRSVSSTSPDPRLLALVYGALLVSSSCAATDAGDGEDSAVTSASETAGSAASTTATTSTDTTSSDTEPADTEPADTEPADTEPADTEPADTEPAADDVVPGAAGDDEMRALSLAEGTERGRLWLLLMRAHHVGGVHMATAAIDLVDTDKVRRLARTQVDVQTYEIDQYDLLLATEYG